MAFPALSRRFFDAETGGLTLQLWQVLGQKCIRISDYYHDFWTDAKRYWLIDIELGFLSLAL